MSVVLIPEGFPGFVGTESGIIVAMRAEGEEFLFAARGDIPVPMRWVKREEFNADPKAVLSADDMIEEEDED